MKSGIIGVVTLLLIGWSSGCVRAQPRSSGHLVLDPEALRNGWVFSLDEGQAQGRKSGKPLMVVLRCNP
ncbi:MAG TPA: hypothetical protein VGX70_06480 [Gemmataceae bacterium]|nr:hypothetical protein [Gemmataceae bacterium]